MDDSRVKSGRSTSTVPPSRSGMMTSASRPITQQGLTGVRPIQTGGNGINRIYKDKRYYMSLMQSHMNSIREELANLRKVTADHRTTSLNRLEARKTAEVSARNYAECQEILSVYNVVLEIQNSQDKIDKLAFETTSLKERNKHVLNELDMLVNYKVRREEKIAALKKDMAEEDQAVQNLIDSFSNEDKVRYIEAVNNNQKSIQQIREMQQEINSYKDGIKQYQKSLSQNQPKQEQLYILQNLSKAKTQREGLLVQLQETLTPAQQREILVQQVKDDKMDTEALINVKNSLEQDLQNKQERLTELETELNEKNAARLKKHKELRDRDDHMRKFIEVFGEKSPMIREKIDVTQQQILTVLDHLTSSVVDINFEELDNIQSNLNQSSLEGLSNQYSLYSSRLSRLKAFQEKYKNELQNLKEKRSSLQNEMITFKTPDKTRDEILSKTDLLKDKQESLRHNLTTTTAAVAEVERRHTEIDAQLINNELYHEIPELEKRIEIIEKENQDMQSALNIALLSEHVTKKLQEIKEITLQRNEKLIFVLRNKKTKANDNDSDIGLNNEVIWQEDRKLISSESKSRAEELNNKEELTISYRVKKPNSKTEILEFDRVTDD